MSGFTQKQGVILKKLMVCMVLLASVAVTNVNTSSPVQAAACGAEPASTTGRSSQTINVPETGTYTIWSRLKAPDANPVEYSVYVDSQCFTIGQAALTPDTLTWVDYENGSTIDKATISLSAGTHTLVLTAGTEDLELDRVMLLSDSCTPTGTGDNCENDTTAPTTSISSPTAGATLSATSTITANASDNDAIDYVEFYRGGSILLGSDSSAPYTYGWDTTGVTDGSYALTVRAYDLSGNITTSSAVNVTVNNAPPVNANITSFTATPSTITEGQSSTLDWSASAGTDCSINQGVGSVALTGSQSVSPASTVTYTLTCNGENGGTADTETATVTVNPAPVNANISSFTATPSTITTGQSSDLNWSVSVGQNCSIDQSIGAVSTSGSQTVSPTVTTTYTMTCDGLNGGTGDTATATVTFDTSPVNANISSFTATPSTIVEGQSSTLNWSVSAGSNCSIDQSVGAVGATGSQSVSPTTTTTYTMTCDGLNGGTTDTETTTLTVNPAPVNANISSFTATPGTVVEGQSSTLNWSVAVGENCSINQSIGAVALSGSQAVSPTATTTYTLTCQGENGGNSDTAVATVTVNPAPVNANITSFSASPATITDAPNQSSQLSWSVDAGTSCSINQSVGSVTLSSTRTISPSTTTTYTLSCSGEHGGASDSAQVTVTVTPAPDTDGDTVKDYVELAAPNAGDGNDDGTPDWQQANVTSFINQRTNAYNTLVSSGDCDVLTEVSSTTGKTAYVMGATSFNLECASAGQEAEVTLLFDQRYNTSNWEVVKLDAGMTNETDISDQVAISSVSVNGQMRTSLTYTLVDGGELDEDREANALIVDPIAVRAATPSIGAPDTGVGTQLGINLTLASAAVIVFGITSVWYIRNISQVVISAHRRK